MYIGGRPRLRRGAGVETGRLGGGRPRRGLRSGSGEEARVSGFELLRDRPAEVVEVAECLWELVSASNGVLQGVFAEATDSLSLSGTLLRLESSSFSFFWALER